MTENVEYRARSAAADWREAFAVKLPGWRGDFAVGIVGMLVCFAGMWIPSPWIDEAATAHIISYSVPEMTELWQTIDANFAPYYLFMHYWTALTGISPFWLRLPSVIAAGVGITALASAGRLLGGLRYQIAYAACFALLPRTTAMALEARPYEMSAMFTALALLLVVRQFKQLDSRRNPYLLAATMVGAVSMHLFSALPIIGLVLGAIAWLAPRQRLRLLITSFAAGLMCTPLAIIAHSQQVQVSWLAQIKYNIADQALVDSWFTSRWNINPVSSDRSPYLHEVPLHWLALMLALVSLAVIVAGVVAARRRNRVQLSIACGPLVISVGVLWIASLIGQPILLSRYLTSASPFFAMLLAEGLLWLKGRWQTVAIAVLLVGAVTLIVAQRQPYAKVWKEDFGFIASTISAQASDGDGFVMEPGTDPHNSARNAVALFPGSFEPLIDLAQAEPTPLTGVFTPDPPVADLASLAPLPARIWVVNRNEEGGPYEEQLSALGWSIQDSLLGPGHTVTLWTKGS